jgi:diacylglycerol kinase (ATP)
MRRRFVLIDNPKSGYGSRRLVPRVLQVMRQRGCTVERATVGPLDTVSADLARIIREGNYDAVIAAGGDGTIRLAAKALIDTEVPLGMIPLGTGNVLAHEIALPRRPAALADLIIRGEERPVELAAANGEPFLLMAGVGFDGSVIGALDHAVKARLGKLAYALPVLRALVQRAEPLTIDIDGTTHHATWAVIANARCYGGRFVIAENAGIAVRGLVAVLIDASTVSELAAALLALVRGTLAARPNVRLIPCRAATIRAAGVVPSQIDGDAFAGTPITVASGAGRVRLIVP